MIIETQPREERANTRPPMDHAGTALRLCAEAAGAGTPLLIEIAGTDADPATATAGSITTVRWTHDRHHADVATAEAEDLARKLAGVIKDQAAVTIHGFGRARLSTADTVLVDPDGPPAGRNARRTAPEPGDPPTGYERSTAVQLVLAHDAPLVAAAIATIALDHHEAAVTIKRSGEEDVVRRPRAFIDPNTAVWTGTFVSEDGDRFNLSVVSAEREGKSGDQLPRGGRVRIDGRHRYDARIPSLKLHDADDRTIDILMVDIELEPATAADGDEAGNEPGEIAYTEVTKAARHALTAAFMGLNAGPEPPTVAGREYLWLCGEMPPDHVRLPSAPLWPPLAELTGDPRCRDEHAKRIDFGSETGDERASEITLAHAVRMNGRIRAVVDSETLRHASGNPRWHALPRLENVEAEETLGGTDKADPHNAAVKLQVRMPDGAATEIFLRTNAILRATTPPERELEPEDAAEMVVLAARGPDDGPTRAITPKELADLCRLAYGPRPVAGNEGRTAEIKEWSRRALAACARRCERRYGTFGPTLKLIEEGIAETALELCPENSTIIVKLRRTGRDGGSAVVEYEPDEDLLDRAT